MNRFNTQNIQQLWEKRSRFAGLRRFSIRRVILQLIGLVALLQTTVVIILQIISIQRRHSRHQGGFPHLNLEERHIGENTLQIYSYGRDLYDAMLAAIDAAQESIYLETYIWKGDEVG